MIGGITKSFVPFMVDQDILKDFKERHPELKQVLESIPIVYAKEIELGLKGSFVYARRVIKDRQNEENY